MEKYFSGMYMGKESIITFVILGLALMLGVAFLLHSAERNRREKLHREAILRKKVNDLSYMLNNFPEGFLNAELKILICKSCLDIYMQLAELSHGNREVPAAIDSLNQRIIDIQSSRQSDTFKPLENLKQIKEIRVLLSMLLNYINRLKNQKSINGSQASSYTKQLQQLMMQTNIDTYIVSANEAEVGEKFKLAIHNYKTAIDKIKANNLTGLYCNHIGGYEEKLAELSSLCPEDGEAQEDIGEEAVGQEWDEFLGSDDDWQRKSEYD